MINTEIEEWRDIEGYEYYQISSLGRVKSLWFGKEKIMKTQKGKFGYCFVGLYKQQKQKNHLIHRLVAKAFIENPQNLPEVNHKDENPSNNCASNLEYCTAKYNANYGLRNQKISRKQKGRKQSQEHIEKKAKARRGKPNIARQKPILQLTKEGEIIKQWCSALQVERELGISATGITACCKKRKYYKSAGGFKWIYLEENKNKINNIL